MSASLVIARRELTELWRDGRLLVAGGLVLLLVATALAVNWQQVRNSEAERQAAQTLDYEDWLKQDRRHPHDAAHQGMHVFKPQPPLAVVDPGITPYVGSTIWLQAHRQSELRFRPAQDATGLQRFGSLSMAWVLQVLGPLVVIVLGFNAFAGERELGTLRQTLSLGVAPRKILAGKALALLVALALFLVPVAWGTLWSVAPSLASLDTWSRMAGLVLGYLLYFGIAVMGVLAVSALAPSTRVSLIVLLSAWVVSVALAPRLVSDVARHWHPSPSRQAFDQSLDQDLDASYRRAWREQFGTEKRWGPDLPLNRWGYALRVDDQAGYTVSDHHFQTLWGSFAAQQRVQEWAGLAIPLLALRAWSMGMAGTDFEAHRHFSVAAEKHRRLMQDIISDDLVEHADPLGHQHFSYQADPHLWAQVPRFDHAPPSSLDAWRHNVLSLLVLTAVLAATSATAVWAAGARKP
ncbi:ABC transporter permease subunit [Schlegelella sp. S2-27]|uniref:ABC transporter permease subunit n=1 Tax=Caldimonas mangrovi TaxID=2944811 RepID=A0ABT0YPI9_9BURK|nr:ABC transporter permease subunit [Caldimonas mangrovi]MCM5680650.1 ABC transporter permease subunit [Caldimonas mangrovi]